MASSTVTRPWLLFVSAGLVATGVYFLLPHGGTAQSVLYDIVGVTSACAIAYGIRLNRPSAPEPWLLFALGNLFFAVADIIFNILVNPPVPSVADGFYLGGYPLLAAGLVWLVVRAGGLHRLAGLMEAAIVTVAFAVCQWVFVVRAIANGSGSVETRSVAAAYPAMDVLLLAVLAGFFVTAAWRTASFRLLVASIFLLLLADEIYGVSPSSYRSGDWIDAGWLLSYVLWAAAALHPTMRELSRPQVGGQRRASPWRIALLTAALLTVPFVLLLQWARGAPLEIPAIVIGAALVSVLVMVRLVGLLRSAERLRRQADAARREVEEKNAQLLEADRLKDEFVALISHDLRTPLTSIIGYVELAQDETETALDEERRGYLEVVARSSERLLRLVDDLLFVARLQAGRLVLNRAQVDLAEVAAQAVHDLEPRAERAGVTVECAPSAPALVQADKGRIFQLLDNLVSNGIKFTPRDGRVDVHVEPTADGYALEVSDTGVGLAPGEAARVFERFFRSAQAVEQHVPGTGLGLFIARAIVDAHGGRISARDRAGGGTTFRVELPARVAAPETELVA